MAQRRDDDDILHWLLAMPLLDHRELMAVAGLPRSTAHRVLARLTASGMVAGVSAGVPGAKRSTRWYLTGLGLAVTASEMGVATDTLLRQHPASAHCLQLLLTRIETVVAVYRIACDLSSISSIHRFNWYRSLALDAVVDIGDGRTVGIMREGPMASPRHLTRRIQALARQHHPACLLVLVPDRVWVREAQRRLSRLPFKTFLAVESDVIAQGSRVVQWADSFDPKPFDFAEVVRRSAGGRLPKETASSRLAVPSVDLDERVQQLRATPESGAAHEYLLYAALEGGEKLLLHAVALWPLATIADLTGLLRMAKSKVISYLHVPVALGLIEKHRLRKRTRFVLSERGLAHLARRDRVSADRLIRRWSPKVRQASEYAGPLSVRGSALGDLMRHLRHTAEAYGFWAELSRQVGAAGGELVTLQPPHRSERRYTVNGRVRTLKPDGYAQVRVNGRDGHFFFEWERRAAHPVQFRAKLRPYLAYYQTRKPLEDHGAYPALLVVLRDELVMAQFLKAATEEIATHTFRTLKVLATYQASLQKEGPLAAIWHTTAGSTTRLMDALGPAL